MYILNYSTNIRWLLKIVYPLFLRCMFVLSGGEGYVDLRLGEETVSGDSLSDKSDLSHLIVWEVEL